MLDNETKRRIDTARDILVGKVPDPKSQVEQITLALIYKFMDDMDLQSVEWGGVRSFFTGDYERYAWSRLFDPSLGGFDMLNLYSEGLTRMSENPHLPLLFRSIFKNAFLPFRDAETLRLFLKTIQEFKYDHSERLGDAYEYLLSVLGSQGDAGQFRTPRHIIDFIVQVINPQKNESILDPACGTAGFLISAYKHILSQNTAPKSEAGGLLNTDERSRLVQNFTGYDIDPGMIRNAQVNLYLHQFPDPKIYEYDTLSDEDRWNDSFDIILANPPFMTPKGFKSTNKRYRIQANRSEVLFVDYIAEHIHPVTGRAAIIVPEGIIFQSSGVYQALRRMLVQEGYLWAVVSLPAGVFQPYSGVKTSILLLDRRVAKKTDRIHFVKIQSDGFEIGAQRRASVKNDLPAALTYLKQTREAILSEKDLPESAELDALSLEKTAFGEDFNLSMDRYRESEAGVAKWEMVRLGDVCELNPLKSELNDLSQATMVSFVPMADLNENSVDFEYKQEKPLAEVYKGYTYFKDNDVLLAKVTPCFENGKAGIAKNLKNGIGFGSSEFFVLRAKEVALPVWIYLNLAYSEFREIGKIQMTGTGGLQRLPKEFVLNFEIPLPPLAHQRALVTQIEQWQKVADGARQIVQHYKPHIVVEEDWERVKLGEVCGIKRGRFSHRPRNAPEFYGGQYPFIQTGDVVRAHGGKVVNSQTLNDLGLSVSKLFEPTIVLITIAANIGDVAILDYPACFTDSVVGLIPFEHIDPYFLCHIMAERKGYLEQIAPQAAQKNINIEILKDVEIPLPPLPIQQKIVAEIERERAMVESARGLIAVKEEKIRNLIAGLWERTETA